MKKPTTSLWPTLAYQLLAVYGILIVNGIFFVNSNTSCTGDASLCSGFNSDVSTTVGAVIIGLGILTAIGLVVTYFTHKTGKAWLGVLAVLVQLYVIIDGLWRIGHSQAVAGVIVFALGIYGTAVAVNSFRRLHSRSITA